MIYLGIVAWLLIFPFLLGMEGKNRRIGFWAAFILSIVITPLVAWFFVMNSGAKNAVGCIHCGNKYNEVEFCGICGKNEAGEVLGKGDFVKK
jgi:branched-subunit amino acid permease